MTCEKRVAGEKYGVCECAVPKISHLLVSWLVN